MGGRPPELLVVGRDLASHALSAFASTAGLRVAHVVPPGEGPPFGGLVWGDDLAAVSDHWFDQAPLERPITGRRLAVLAGASSVSLEFQDHRAQRPGRPVRSVRGARVADWLQGLAIEHGTEVRAGRPGALCRRAGRVVGIAVDGTEAPATVVALGDGADAPTGPGPARRCRASRLFSLPASTIQERFGPGPHRATCREVIIGGRARGEAAIGFVLPYSDSVEVGVDVRSTGDLAGASSWALDRLQGHPGVAPLVRGAASPAEAIGPARPESTGPLGGRGWISVGSAAGLGIAAGPGAVPSVTHELLRASSASRGCVEAIRGGGDPSAAAPKYRHYLADAGVFRDAAADRARDQRYRFAARWQERYPAELSRLMGDLMTEVSGPKRRVLDTVRRARRRSGLSWRRLASDLLAAGATL